MVAVPEGDIIEWTYNVFEDSLSAWHCILTDGQAPEHHAVSPPALVGAVSSPETLLLIRPGPALRRPADLFSHVVSLEEPHLTPRVFSLRVLLPLVRQPGQWHAHRSLLLGVGVLPTVTQQEHTWWRQ